MKTRSQQPPKCEKVLLIDEDQIDNFINERMITTSNFARNVIVKNSGLSALEYLKNLYENNKQEFPQIIFLDLNMPVMDGFEFLDEYDKLINKDPEIMNRCKVIVLSSSISPMDIDRASTNSYVYKYLNKPLSEKYLDAINV